MDVQKLIPQFYYDLISRVLPGGTALIGLSKALGGTPGSTLANLFEGATALQASAPFLALTFFILSYLLGQLIAPLSYLFEVAIADRIFGRTARVLGSLSRNKANCPPRVARFILTEIGYDCEAAVAEDLDKFHTTEIFILFDWLQMNRSDVGTRLAKHRAEYRMFGGICIAAIMSMTLHVAAATFELAGVTEIRVGVTVPLFVSLLSLCGMERMKYIFQWEVLHHYYVAKGRPGPEANLPLTDMYPESAEAKSDQEKTKVGIG